MRFSIVTPSFRSGPWLRLCVASVADQTVDLEHLVQDAGSDDGSLNDLPARDERLQVVVEPDSGMYDAINRGLRRARGEVIAYLNCDEQYLPGALVRVRQFFVTHPTVEVVFGSAVVVNQEGNYLWHRKVLPPTLSHTWTNPLTTLSCATFFRRSILEQRDGWFDSDWKVCGDSVWMLNLLKQNVSMASISTFTSAFTHTGRNLSLDARAAQEARRFYATAPHRLRFARPLILAHHRLRRFCHGVYRQPPFDYEIFTPASPHQRVRHHVAHPTSRWRW